METGHPLPNLWMVSQELLGLVIVPPGLPGGDVHRENPPYLLTNPRVLINLKV
jgi:hypothetical protein